MTSQAIFLSQLINDFKQTFTLDNAKSTLFILATYLLINNNPSSDFFFKILILVNFIVSFAHYGLDTNNISLRKTEYFIITYIYVYTFTKFPLFTALVCLPGLEIEEYRLSLIGISVSTFIFERRLSINKFYNNNLEFEILYIIINIIIPVLYYYSFSEKWHSSEKLIWHFFYSIQLFGLNYINYELIEPLSCVK